MKCPKCNSEMKNVMCFESGRNYAFHKCNKCHTKTHKKRIHFEDLGGKNEDSSNSKRV